MSRVRRRKLGVVCHGLAQIRRPFAHERRLRHLVVCHRLPVFAHLVWRWFPCVVRASSRQASLCAAPTGRRRLCLTDAQTLDCVARLGGVARRRAGRRLARPPLGSATPSPDCAIAMTARASARLRGASRLRQRRCVASSSEASPTAAGSSPAAAALRVVRPGTSAVAGPCAPHTRP